MDDIFSQYEKIFYLFGYRHTNTSYWQRYTVHTYIHWAPVCALLAIMCTMHLVLSLIRFIRRIVNNNGVPLRIDVVDCTLLRHVPCAQMHTTWTVNNWNSFGISDDKKFTLNSYFTSQLSHGNVKIKSKLSQIHRVNSNFYHSESIRFLFRVLCLCVCAEKWKTNAHEKTRSTKYENMTNQIRMN